MVVLWTEGSLTRDAATVSESRCTTTSPALVRTVASTTGYSSGTSESRYRLILLLVSASRTSTPRCSYHSLPMELTTMVPSVSTAELVVS